MIFWGRKRLFQPAFSLLFLALFFFGSPVRAGPGTIPCRFRVLADDESVFRFGVELRTLPPGKMPDALAAHLLKIGDSLYVAPVFSGRFVPVTRRFSLAVLELQTDPLPTDFSAQVRSEAGFPADSLYPAERPGRVAGLPVPVDRGWVTVRKIGSAGDVPVYSLRIFPLRRSPADGRWLRLIRLKAQITYDFSSGLAPVGRLSRFRGFQKTVLNARALRTLQSQLPQKPLRRPVQKAASFENCTVYVEKPGWYRITYSDLKQAGVPVGNIRTAGLRLQHQGADVPFYLSGPHGEKLSRRNAIEFWGEKNRNVDFPEVEDLYYDPYLETGVYILTWDGSGGVRIGEMSGGPDGENGTVQPRWFVESLHIETNSRFDRLGWAPAGRMTDHRFMGGDIGGGQMEEFTVPFPGYVPGARQPVRVAVWLQARTPGRHEMDVFFRRAFVGRAVWDGIAAFRFRGRVSGFAAEPQERTREANLTLINRSDDPLNFVLLNSADLEYPRELRAEKGALRFGRPPSPRSGTFDFVLRNFTSPEIQVFKLGSYRLLNVRIFSYQDTLLGQRFAVECRDYSISPGDRYLAVQPSAKLRPDSLAYYRPEDDLRSPLNGADYLIIAAHDFVKNKKLRQFISFRQRRYTVKLVDVEDVYQQFHAGIPGPAAIRSFLRYVRENWRQVPRYVLLIGEAPGNSLSIFRWKRNCIPVFYYQTYKYGAAVSDPWYVLGRAGDLVPEMAIGRWPVDSNEELSALVDKLLRYAQQPGAAPWRDRLLMIVGSGDYFSRQATQLLKDVFPPGYESLRLHARPRPPFLSGTDALVEEWNKGLAYMNFFGHGGGMVWADNQLFRFEDLSRLQNGPRLPFVTSMTCFTAAFDARDALGESLLLRENGGASAVYGSSGVGWVWNDYYLLRELLNAMFRAPDQPIGDWVRAGTAAYAATYFTPQAASMVHQYNLLGDPALRIHLARDSLRVQVVRRFLFSGDTLTAKIAVPGPDARLYWMIGREDGFVAVQGKNEALPDGRLAVVLPPDLPRGLYYLKVLAVFPGKSRMAHGAAAFTVGEMRILDVRLLPPVPAPEDTLQISCRLLGPEVQNARVFFVFRHEELDSVELRYRPEAGGFAGILPLNGLPPGAEVRYQLRAYGKNLHAATGWRTFRIGEMPDFWVLPGSVKQTEASQELFLQAEIANFRNFEPGVLPVSFWTTGRDQREPLFLGADTVRLVRYAQVVAKIPCDLPVGWHKIRIKVDPQNRISETDESNNTWERAVFFPYMKVTAPEPVRFAVDSLWEVELQPPTVLLGKMLVFGRPDSLPFATGQDVHPLFLEKRTLHPFSLRTLPELQLDSLRLKIFTSDPKAARAFATDSSAGLFRYFEQEKVWALAAKPALHGDTLTFSASRLGTFAWLCSSDRTPPEVRIGAQQRGFFDGSFVPAAPRFLIRITDENGAHPDPRRVRIRLNGVPVESSDFTLKPNYRNGELLLEFTPEGLAGENQMTVSAADCIGNRCQPVLLRFKIARRADILPLGNYPNPFSFETVFCYELTGDADRFSLRIFSPDGRLVKEFSEQSVPDDPDPAQAGYHEITWDGLDKNGEVVGNGVYFYQYRAVFGKKVIKKTGKIARIR